MKMFKKLLAVTLAGVMALCVLTGCSGGSSTSTTMVEAMKKADTVGYTIKTNEQLDKRVETFAEQLNGQYKTEKDAAEKKGEELTLETYVQSQVQKFTTDYEHTTTFGQLGDVLEVSVAKVKGTGVNTQAQDLWKGMTQVAPDAAATIDKDKDTYLSVSKVVPVEDDDEVAYYRIAIFIATKTASAQG